MLRSILCFILIALLCESSLAKPKESMCGYAAMLKAYDTLGDCYWYGVYFDKDIEKAKISYLQGAMQRGGQGEYAKLRAGNVLLFDSSSPLDNAMGLYILKTFADSEDVQKVSEPEYAGDYTRRGTARYYLSIHLARQKDFEGAQNYLQKSLDDNHGYSAYALKYLHEAGQLSPPMNDEQLGELEKEGDSKQRRFFYWQAEQGYSCWLKHQIEGDGGVAFPVDPDLASRLLDKHGICIRAESAR